MKYRFGIAAVAAVCALGSAAFCAPPTQQEIQEAKKWTAAKFDAVTPGKNTGQAGLVVYRNNDAVQHNNRGGQPLSLGGKNYEKGLFTHAVSEILVQLPSAGSRFTAVVGVDDRSSAGSVVFSVEVEGAEVYNSGIVRHGDAPKTLDVGLNGADRFMIKVGDAGDGIPHDQADWVDAKVTLENGQEMWVSDMRQVAPPLKEYTTELPFSFVYDGKKSTEFLHAWNLEKQVQKLDDNREQITLIYTDPATKLEVKCVMVSYNDFPTTEWTLYFTNKGSANTPILSDINSIDTEFSRDSIQPFNIHWDIGTAIRQNDFEPQITQLPAAQTQRFASDGGRPCGLVSPYFNLNGNGRGVIIVVGWPGQWELEYVADNANGVNVAGGQEYFNAYLKPGEMVRSPLMVVQFYEGDFVRSQNVWRRWYLAHNAPKVDGKIYEPQFQACTSHQFNEMLNANPENQIDYIGRYLDAGIKLDYWWMDAGWYPNTGSWTFTGTWEVDKSRFPNGLKPITDYGRSRDVESILWFEPERVHTGTEIWNEHRDWVISGPNFGSADYGNIFDMGDPDAWEWITNRVISILRENGIDYYREDFNIQPLAYWLQKDQPNRTGTTENHYIQGHLAYWDAIVAAFPGMKIDSCASGGHRNDLETMRRSVPLLRSDYIFEPVGQQCHTYGLSYWLPWQGTGVRNDDIYDLRSTIVISQTGGWDLKGEGQGENYDAYRQYYNDWKEIAPLLLGDFYPLTPYSTSQEVWMAWQYDSPEKGAGVIQSFRRADCIYSVAQFKLRGLDADSNYLIKCRDKGSLGAFSGRELMEKGLYVTLENPKSAGILLYEKL